MTTYRWADIKRRGRTAAAVRQLDREVAAELLDMDLRAIRELLGKTQAEVAEASQMAQSEISRLERRRDHHLSTLRRIVKAMGGELEVVATFGDRRVRLRAV